MSLFCGKKTHYKSRKWSNFSEFGLKSVQFLTIRTFKQKTFWGQLETIFSDRNWGALGNNCHYLRPHFCALFCQRLWQHHSTETVVNKWALSLSSSKSHQFVSNIEKRLRSKIFFLNLKTPQLLCPFFDWFEKELQGMMILYYFVP